MLPGQMLPGQMLSWQLESVHKGPRNLHLKFGQNRVSNSWDIVDIEFAVVVVVVVVVDQSHFHVKPNLGYVRLSWGWVGVLTINIHLPAPCYPLTTLCQFLAVLLLFGVGGWVGLEIIRNKPNSVQLNKISLMQLSLTIIHREYRIYYQTKSQLL